MHRTHYTFAIPSLRIFNRRTELPRRKEGEHCQVKFWFVYDFTARIFYACIRKMFSIASKLGAAYIRSAKQARSSEQLHCLKQAYLMLQNELQLYIRFLYYVKKYRCFMLMKKLILRQNSKFKAGFKISGAQDRLGALSSSTVWNKQNISISTLAGFYHVNKVSIFYVDEKVDLKWNSKLKAGFSWVQNIKSARQARSSQQQLHSL